MYTINQVTKLSIMAISVSTLLSGCLATSALWDAEAIQDSEKTVILKDRVSALGKPAEPVPNFPNALVLLGEENDYLITSAEQNPAIVEHLFSNLDAKALTIISNHVSVPIEHIDYDWVHDPVSRIDFEIDPSIQYREYADQSFKQSGVGTTLNISFVKPADKITAQEKAKLQQYGFQCTSDRLAHRRNGDYTYDKSPTVYTWCVRPTKINLTAITKSQSSTQAMRQLNTSRTIQVSYSQNVKGRKYATNTGIVLLTPLAIAVDVVTFPVQWLFCSVAWCQ